MDGCIGARTDNDGTPIRELLAELGLDTIG